MRHSLVTVIAAHPKRRAAAELLDEARTQKRKGRERIAAGGGAPAHLRGA